LSTDYYGDTVIIGTPNQNYNASTENWGYTYVYDRTVQNFEAQYTSIPLVPQTFTLAWTPSTTSITVTASDSTLDRFTCASSSTLNIGDPITFTGTVFGGIALSTVYYVLAKPSGTTFTISATRSGSTLQLNNGSGSMTATQQDTPLYVSVNGTLIDDSTYFNVGSTITIVQGLNAGDIITVSGNNFVLSQTLTTENTPRIGV